MVNRLPVAFAQSRDGGRVTAEDLKCVTRRQPTDREIGDMIFAMRVAKHVKSNAIVMPAMRPRFALVQARCHALIEPYRRPEGRRSRPGQGA